VVRRKLKETITEKLLEILDELHPDVDFETEEHLIDNKILDSFDIVTLVAEIDAEYDVAIPAEELIPENFNSAKALYALVEKLMDE
jgi:acyl carrier protein